MLYENVSSIPHATTSSRFTTRDVRQDVIAFRLLHWWKFNALVHIHLILVHSFTEVWINMKKNRK